MAELEAAFAETVGCEHAVAFAYARTALAFVLRAWGLQGAEVICPGYACVAIGHAVVASGPCSSTARLST